MQVAEQWAALDPEQRRVQDGARSMLNLLGFLLRRLGPQGGRAPCPCPADCS